MVYNCRCALIKESNHIYRDGEWHSNELPNYDDSVGIPMFEKAVRNTLDEAVKRGIITPDAPQYLNDVTVIENPHFPADYVESMRKSMPPDQIKSELNGEPFHIAPDGTKIEIKDSVPPEIIAGDGGRGEWTVPPKPDLCRMVTLLTSCECPNNCQG